MSRVVELLRREVTQEEYREIRELWKRHSLAEQERDLPGLIATLTEDCVYELVQTGDRWEGHDGARRFYTELLTAFPDIHFDLTEIVIGPQGVCEEALVTATHTASWLGREPTGDRVEFPVVIFFPWDPAARRFKGERVHVPGMAVSGPSFSSSVKIAVIGRGNVGGGLARLWERAGHEVTTFGRDGGDASAAEVVVIAVPSDAIADAVSRVSGIDGKPAIDATNAYHGRNEKFESLAAEVKASVGGPTAKAFNANFAALYERIGEQRDRPGCLYCADPEAAEIAERLIRDAGYDPVPVGGLDQARALEDFLGLLGAVTQSAGGHVFYRFARPGTL